VLIEFNLTPDQRQKLEPVMRRAVGDRRGLFFVGLSLVDFPSGSTLQLHAHYTHPGLAVNLLWRIMAMLKGELHV
jgi:hypothetical protein